jgi:dihydroflavonol-4-reductase
MTGEARNALVTGGTGFVGSHVVDTLLEAGYRVRCLVRATSRLRWLEGKPVELFEADLRGGNLAGAVAGVDRVIHCAGLTRGSRRALFATNYEGTRSLLDACVASGVRLRFLFCSSQAAAGPGAVQRAREPEDAPAPTSDYGRSKLAAEQEVLKRSAQLDVVVLRPVCVYGPRDEDTLPLVRMATRGVIVVPGLRRRLIQVVHVRDVAEALRRAAERREAVGNTYFVAHPTVIDWRQLSTALDRAVGRRLIRLRLPSPLLWPMGAAGELLGGQRRAGRLDLRRARDLSQRAWTCRVDRTMEDLDWEPRYDIVKGVRDTAAWYREEGWL